MTAIRLARLAGKWAAAGVGVAAASYAVYAAVAWSRYGRVMRPSGEDADALLDRFMPSYEVVERHHVRVGAPAEIAFAAATEMDLQQSPVVRAIFKGREWIMRSHATRDAGPRGLLAQMQAIGWGVLAEITDREIVMGAVTQPWLADVVFRALSPDRFAAFDEPDYVKIVWTLRCDPIGDQSVFRTETRVSTTSPTARAKFRRYWSLVSPGIILIRWMTLGPLKAEAERRTRAISIESPFISSSRAIPITRLAR
jgi:hypothetical protein